MSQPEAYIGEAGNFFDENGSLTNESTRDFLRSFMEAFEQWVKTHVNEPDA